MFEGRKTQNLNEKIENIKKVELLSGNPLFAWYCRKSAIIYQNPMAKECRDTDWHTFKKRFKRYSVSYSHDRDNLLLAVNRFQELGPLTWIFVSYLSVFEYTIRYLEMLYAGRNFESEDLHQRIKQLIPYISEMEGMLVQKNGNEYYLISELEKAKDFAEDGDEIRLNDKFMDSFSQAEEKLYKMVLSRLSELKSMIKSGLVKQSFNDQIEPRAADAQMSDIADQIVEIHPVSSRCLSIDRKEADDS